jgi:hypothetical protein
MPIALMTIVAGFIGFIPVAYPDPSPRLAPKVRQIQPVTDGSRADVGLGECATDFAVKDGAGHAVANATVRMHIRYGLLGLRRMDLSVGTAADGRAHIQGLPDSASLLRYEVGKGRIVAQITHDLSRQCRERYDVTLK